MANLIIFAPDMGATPICLAITHMGKDKRNDTNPRRKKMM
jgi:hypothetical protein